MIQGRWHRRRHGSIQAAYAVGAVVAALACIASCGRDAPPRTENLSSATLRLGVSQVQSSLNNPLAGLRQLIQLLTVESLVRLDNDGRLLPQLADRWALTDGGRSVVVTLKSGVKFHDGSPVNPQTLSDVLRDALRGTTGPLFEDIDHIRVAGADAVEIGFKRPSPLLLESLEVVVKKPGQAIVATGPFIVAVDKPTELRANADYYLGPANIREVQIVTFPSVRTAWAELLRNRIDMLYEVGLDAFDSLQNSTNVAVFTYIRHYQFLIAFNTEQPVFRSSKLRRALNLAIDRQDLVRQALGGHGVASSTPINGQYWALASDAATFPFDPQQAAAALGGARVRFTCLVPTDQIYERIALHVKRQLSAVGVEMTVRSVTQDELFEAERARKYDAVLTEGISGPSVLRLYQVWNSKSELNLGGFGNASVDKALERVRYAETETDFRQRVGALQQAFVDDPPAIFLAWSERLRAISKRFVVPTPPPGRDVLATVRLWTPRTDERVASRN
jgi:peptide/nickel transport system substrate-binding protein